MMPSVSPAREHINSGRPAPGAMPTRARANAAQIARVLSLALLVIAVGGEILLLLVALVPQTIWAAHGYPNGPIPLKLAPLVAGVFYILPSLTGALCRRWQTAVVLATLPAWLDLGLFAVGASAGGHIGPFYLAQEPHSTSAVGTLELFVALGALGWLARGALLALFGRGEWARR
jgi:hypothetical protein